MELVFIHGYGGGPEDWNGVCKGLNEIVHQTTATLPGHSNRKYDRGPFTIERCATEILATSFTKPTILVGHSMGTRIAIEIASRKPSKLIGLVLVDGSNAPTSEQEVTEEFEDRINRLGFDKAMDWTLASMLVEKLSMETQAKMFARIRAISRDAALSFEISMAAWDRNFFAHCVSKLQIPVKIVQSTSLIPSKGWARKPVSECSESIWLESWRKLTLAEIIRVEGCGHYVMIEEPLVVINAIKSLAATVRPLKI